MISVIIPVYNIEAYIEKTVLSVLAQTCSNFELLLINDGSTDSSEKICRALAEKDSRIRFFTKENGGVSSARNFGLDAAKGDYIFFLDGDDCLHPECLEKLLAKMSDEIDVAFCDYQEVNDEGFLSELILQHKHFEGKISASEAMEDLLKAQIYPRVVWGKLYRKNIWETLRFNHMAYSEDTFAMFELLQRIQTLYSIDEPLYDYLQRGSSASRQKKTNEFENHTETLLQLYKKALSDHPQVISYPAEEYIGVAYGLLKNYISKNQKAKALELIKTMQFVYKTSHLKSNAFARKILKAPAPVIYFLLRLKQNTPTD